MRDLTRFALENDQRIKVVGEAEDAITCLRELAEIRPDVLVLDLRMPRVTGLEAVSDIRAATPSTRIVVYSQHIDEETEAELGAAGVDAWLHKEKRTSPPCAKRWSGSGAAGPPVTRTCFGGVRGGTGRPGLDAQA